MVDASWVPRRNEIIHLDDVGGAGHEQNGDRPHLVLTGQGYNDKLGLVVCVPVTTKVKGSPFEVPLADLNKPSRRHPTGWRVCFRDLVAQPDADGLRRAVMLYQVNVQ